VIRSRFEREYFQKFKFTEAQVNRHFQNALRDLEIAQRDSFAEVRFSYSYQALIKAGIALLAKVAQVRVRSVPGHHIKILTKMSELLDDEDILTIGNAMRMKRNLDFYSGGEVITEKEAADYLKFVEKILEKAKEAIS
jgi:uncharacterized ubiquitin-like protein YukD